jgi:tetratricopeptide (TPR) repeat protein
VIQLPSLITPDQRAALQREILGATRERMVREICETLEWLTAEHPLLFVFEDVHWVDPSTLDLVSALARRREPARFMLLCTYRPMDVSLSQSPLKGLKEDLQVHQLCEEIALGRLHESEVSKYLASEFATESLPTELVGLISQRSGGHALFMVAMVRDMVQKGLIVRDGEAWRLSASLAAIDPGVPETLQRMLELQLEQSSVREQRVLAGASVAGDRFSAWTVASTLGATPDEVEDLCEALAERHHVIKSAGLDELADGSVSACYEFRHSLYRQVIYKQLSEVSRARLHRRLGEGLELLRASSTKEQELAAEIALHFERGRDYQRAIRYLVLTAGSAAGRFAYRDAIEVLQHALDLARKHDLRGGADAEIQILGLIGDAHYALGAMEDSARAYSSAAARAAQAGLKAAQVNALTSLMRPFGLIDPDKGIAAVDQAVRVSSSLDDALLVARTQLLAAATRLLYDAWRKEDADLCASAHETLGRLGDASTPPYHQMMYAYVRALQGHYREVGEIFDGYLARENGTDRLMTYHFALGGKTVALLHLGQLGEALRIVRAARDAAEKNGNDPWLFKFREAWLRTLALDFSGARQLGESIVRPKPRYQTAQPETIARIAAGYAELERGNYGQAIEYFRQAGDPQVTPKFFQHWLWRMESQRGSSEVWLQSGDLAKARKEAEAFLESALSTANPSLQTQAWDLRSRVAMAEQDWMGAQEYVRRALGILEKFEIPVAAWRVESTARDLFLHAKDHSAAETHRARAEAHILAIANSFAPDEPLRHSFLTAAPVSRILDGGKTRNRIAS